MGPGGAPSTATWRGNRGRNYYERWMNSRFPTQKANQMTAGIAAKSATIPNGIVIGAVNAKAVASKETMSSP